MARTIHNFIGFETGGLEEASATAGSFAISTTYPRTGRYCLHGDGNADQYDIDAFLEGTDQGDYYLLGFAFRTQDATPASDATIMRALDTGGATIFTLILQSTGYLKITDQASTNFSATTTVLQDDTWYYIEISWESTGTNDQMDVYLDGSSELAITTADFDTGTALGDYRLFGGHNAGIGDFFFDDFYCCSGATGIGQAFGPLTVVLGAYANTAEDATDQGTTLANGTWANTSEIPFGTTNFAEYAGDNDQGHTRLDEGKLPGWMLDWYPMQSFLANKFIWYNKYDSTKTPMYCRWGGNVGSGDLMTNLSVTPTKSYVIYAKISTAGPTSDDHFLCIGADNGATKNDVQIAAAVCCVLTSVALHSSSIASLVPNAQNSYGGPFSV